MTSPSRIPSAARRRRVSAVPSASTCRTTVARLTPMARRVAISPSRSFTVIVSSVAISSTVDDQAHAAEDVGELAEVDQALAEVRDEVGDAVDLDLGKPRAAATRQRRHRGILAGLHQDHGGAVLGVPAASRCMTGSTVPTDGWPRVVIEPADHAAHDEPAAHGGGDDLRVEPPDQRDGIADRRPGAAGPPGSLSTTPACRLARGRVPRMSWYSDCASGSIP